MCSENIIFVWIVDHRNLITIRRVWSSQCSHIVCLASVDRSHKAFDLIGSSWMLVRGWTLLMVDVDRTPLILICWLLGCSRLLADALERLLILSLKFGGLTTLVAHVLTFRTLGQNPRVHFEENAPTCFFLYSPFFFFSHARNLSHATLFFLWYSVRTPSLISFLKRCKTTSLQYFYRVRG